MLKSLIRTVYRQNFKGERNKSKMKRSISAVICTAIILSSFAFSAQAKTAAYPKAGTVSTVSGRLNVRSTAGGSILTSIDKGSYVSLLEESNGWYKLEYSAGKYGYSSADYITKLESSYGAKVKTTSGRLNVRANAHGEIINALTSGTQVTVISESNGWSRIIFNGMNMGYVSSKYLVKTESGYSAVSLSVPDYKQTDPRWASTKIGGTKYTINQIGCTTTALAMTESYRTGKSIYPDAMAKSLSYTSSGSLYWPNNYSTTTDFDNYMERIYSLLKQGKPVIIGAKKANGSQHWVVVTGASAVTELTPTAFKINDPGAASRTNLGQFFTSFPYLHKIVWYN